MKGYEQLRDLSTPLAIKSLNDQLQTLFFRVSNIVEKDLRPGSVTEKIIKVDSIDGIHIKPKSITTEHIIAEIATLEELNAVVAKIGHLEAVSATISDLSAAVARIANLEATRALITDLEAINASIANLIVETAKISNLEAEIGRIDTVIANVITTEELNAAVAVINQALINKAEVEDLTAVHGDINELRSTMITVDALDAQVGRIDWLYANTLNVDALNAAEARINLLLADKANITDLSAVNANVTNLSGDYGSFKILAANTFTAIDASIQSLLGQDAIFTNLFAGNITSEHIKTNSLTGSELSATSTLRVGTGDDIAVMTGQHPLYRLFIGNQDPSLAPFSVTQTGKVSAFDVDIIGKITAIEGNFIGSILVGDTAGIDGSADNPVKFWSGGSIDNANFRVFNTGLVETNQLKLTNSLEASNAVLSGLLRVGNEGILLDGNTGSISSANFASGLSGWFIGNDGSSEFSDISVRGKIVSSVFVQNEIHAQGGTLLIRPAGILANTIMYSGTGDIEVLVESNGQFQRFEQDDIIRIKDIWLRIKKVEALGTEYFKYTCTRVSGATTFTFGKGEAIVNMGQTGQGGILLTSSMNKAPYMDIYENTATPWTNQTLKVRLGNLSGIVDPEFGNLQGYGLFSDNAYLKGSLFLPNAGITNAGNLGGSVRLWAGSSFMDRENAPFRVLQDGTLYARKGIFEGEIRGAYGTFSGSVDVSNISIGSNGIFQIKDDNQENVVVGSKLGLSVYGEGFSLYSDSYSNKPFLSVAQDDWRHRVRGERFSTWNVHRALANEPTEGRNLLKGTSSEWQQRTITAGAFNNVIQGLFSLEDYDLKAGDTVTLSMFLRTTDEIGVRARFEVYLDDSNRNQYTGSVISNGEGKSSVTVKIIENRPKFRVMVQPGVTPAPTSFTYEIKEIKLEKGTRVTEWSPAPEDLNPPAIDTHRVARMDNGTIDFSFLQQNLISDFDFEEKAAYKSPANFKIGTVDSEYGKFLSYTDKSNGNFFFLGMDASGNQDINRKVRIGINKLTADYSLDIAGTLGVSDSINLQKAQLIYREVDNGLDIIIYD